VRQRWLVVALVMMLASLAACQWLVGIDDGELVVPIRDAGTDSPRDLCPHVAPPVVPEQSDSDEEGSFVFAFSSVDPTGRRDGGEVVGFDLDRVCSCDGRDPLGANPTCLARDPAVSRDAGVCDPDGGIDNGFADVVSEFELLLSRADMVKTFNREIHCGRQSVLVFLSKYNGQANDPGVVVGLVESYGIRESHDGGEQPSECTSDGGDGGGTFPPKYDGTDRWSVPKGKVTPTVAGPVTGAPATGWVRNFELVIDIRDPRVETRLPVVLGTTVSSISGVVLSAKLVPVDAEGKDIPVDGAGKIQSTDGKAARFRLTNGILSGRVAVDDVLTGLSTLNIGDEPLCHQPVVMEVMTPTLCNAADTMTIPSRDSKGNRCDAITIALQFDAVPAILGIEHVNDERDAGCPRVSCGP
jgi:hypothetical protein